MEGIVVKSCNMLKKMNRISLFYLSIIVHSHLSSILDFVTNVKKWKVGVNYCVNKLLYHIINQDIFSNNLFKETRLDLIPVELLI